LPDIKINIARETREKHEKMGYGRTLAILLWPLCGGVSAETAKI
jgi:hypothetical protein